MPIPFLLHIWCSDQTTLPHHTQNYGHHPQYSGQTPFQEGTSDFHYELKLYMKGPRTVYAIPVSPGWLTLSWLGKTAKLIFIFFSFRLLLRWSMGNIMWQSQSHKRCNKSYITVMSHIVTSHSHNMWQRSQLTDMRTVGNKMHSHDSNCIYSVANLTGTLSSSLC